VYWRKGWDSNPRYPCRHAGFQDRCLKPLGHPSNPLKLFSYLRNAWGRECPFATALLPNVFGAPVYGGAQYVVNSRGGGGRVGVAADEQARVPTGGRKDFLLKFADSRLHNLRLWPVYLRG
jgi:hypothetical protein